MSLHMYKKFGFALKPHCEYTLSGIVYTNVNSLMIFGVFFSTLSLLFHLTVIQLPLNLLVLIRYTEINLLK